MITIEVERREAIDDLGDRPDLLELRERMVDGAIAAAHLILDGVGTGVGRDWEWIGDRVVTVVLRASFLMWVRDLGWVAGEDPATWVAVWAQFREAARRWGGLLFESDDDAAIAGCPVEDEVVARAIAALRWVDGRRLDYAEVPVDWFGAVFEGLLSLEITEGHWITHDEDRSTGRHYTPRSLTMPTAARALASLWVRLGDRVTASDVLAIRVLDPAMGAGALLVETARQLSDRLLKLWRRDLGANAEPAIVARRLVATHCVCGVDLDWRAVMASRSLLWLWLGDPSARLDFCDRRIIQGDSLLGRFGD